MFIHINPQCLTNTLLYKLTWEYLKSMEFFIIKNWIAYVSIKAYNSYYFKKCFSIMPKRKYFFFFYSEEKFYPVLVQWIRKQEVNIFFLFCMKFFLLECFISCNQRKNTIYSTTFYSYTLFEHSRFSTLHF